MSPSVEPFNEAKYKALMDGLECKEINYSFTKECNGVFRIDSEYYKKSALKIINHIKANSHCILGEHFDVSKLAGFEYTKYFTEENTTTADYYLAITSKNVQSEHLLLDDTLRIDKSVADEFLKRSKLKVGDIIMSYTGEYRRALTLEHENLQLGPNVCRLTPKDAVLNSYYVSAFLNSRCGQAILDKEKTLSAQPTVAMSRIRTIPIPLFSSSFQTKIAQIIKKDNKTISSSDNKYKLATSILYDSLKFDTEYVAHNNCAVKSFKEILDNEVRLDAEFYHPKYEYLFSMLQNNSLFTKKIGEIQTYNARGVQPAYSIDGELNVVNSKHILDTSLDYDNLEKTHYSIWNSKAKAQIHLNDILTYTTGANIGRTSPYLSKERAIASNHVNILRLNQGYNCLYVALVMNSQIGRMQVERLSAGSAQQELYPKDIDKIVIPFVEESLQKEIEKYIIEAYEEKTKGFSLLRLTIDAVGLAVEQSEDFALNWLKEKEVESQCQVIEIGFNK